MTMYTIKSCIVYGYEVPSSDLEELKIEVEVDKNFNLKIKENDENFDKFSEYLKRRISSSQSIYFSLDRMIVTTNNAYHLNLLKKLIGENVKLNEAEDFINAEDLIWLLKADNQIDIEKISNCSKSFRNAV